jgi:hypothetical protein
VIDELKRIIEDFPGETQLELHIGPRVVRFGPSYRVDARSAAPELRNVLGSTAAPPVPTPA